MSEHREVWTAQQDRINTKLESAIQKFTAEQGKTDNPVKLSISKLLAKADVNESTFYHNGGQWKLDDLKGIKYLENKGKITVRPQTFLEEADL